MKYIFLILVMFFISCENNTKTVNVVEQSSDGDITQQTNDDEYDLESDDPHIDKVNGIEWSETVFETIQVNNAHDKCENLIENGNSDYTLATIEQLQTLVKDCSNSDGCEEAEDGRYSVFGDVGRFWSSSQDYVTDIVAVKSPYSVPLYLDFNVGVKGYDRLSENNYYRARCVRENLSPGSKRKDQQCLNIPANAKWNTVDSITQTWNDNEWLPSLESQYNEDPSKEECRYICEEGFVEKERACVTPQIAAKWSKSSEQEMTVFEAIKYCENLEENGKDDWNLPTISQMRELIVNCDYSQIGGECNVTDECLDRSECWDELCAGCGVKKNYSYSVFWEDKIYITFSPNTELWAGDCDMENDIEFCLNDIWTMDFQFGRIMDEMSKNKHYVRCVR